MGPWRFNEPRRVTESAMPEDKTRMDQIDLDWDDFQWVGQVEDLSPLGMEFEIHVETKDGEPVLPHPRQVKIWQEVERDRAEYENLIRSALFGYYVKMRPQYERAGPGWVANMPVIRHQDEIAEMILLNYLLIRWPYDEMDPAIGFSYACQWDQEHGAGVVIKDLRVVDVGGADCLYCR